MDIELFYERLFKPSRIDTFFNNPIVKEIKDGKFYYEPDKRSLTHLYKIAPIFKKYFSDKKIQASIVYKQVMDIAYYSPENPIEGYLASVKSIAGSIFKGKEVKDALRSIKKNSELVNLADRLYRAVMRELNNSDELVYELLDKCIQINKVGPNELLAVALGAKSSYSAFLYADSIEGWRAKWILDIIKSDPSEKYEQLVFNYCFTGGYSFPEFILQDVEQIENKADRWAKYIFYDYQSILENLGTQNIIGLGGSKILKDAFKYIFPSTAETKLFIDYVLTTERIVTKDLIKRIIMDNIGNADYPFIKKGVLNA